MKNLSELTSEEMKALSVGEQVISESVRAAGYVAATFETTVVLRHADGSMAVSFLATDQTSVALQMTVSSTKEEGVGFTLGPPIVRPVLVELGQMRGAPRNFVDLALGLLEHLSKQEPETLAERRERLEAILKGLPR